MAYLRLFILFVAWIYAMVGYFWPIDKVPPLNIPMILVIPGHYVPTPAAIIEIVAITAFAIAFLWSVPRRKFFTKTILKTDFRHVGWSRYYKISQLETFKKIMGLIVVVSFFVTVARGVYDWGDVLRLFFLAFGLVFGVYLILYCIVLWRLESLRANLDEYHEELIDRIRQGERDGNKITIPTRCYKDDSHNVCVNIMPTSTDPRDYVEAELQAAGMQVIGDLKQRLPVSCVKLLFFWNCNFVTSGNHMVNVLLRVTNARGEVKKELLHKTY